LINLLGVKQIIVGINKVCFIWDFIWDLFVCFVLLFVLFCYFVSLVLLFVFYSYNVELIGRWTLMLPATRNPATKRSRRRWCPL
jgi:hypothetical protein